MASPTRLPEILKKHEASILAEWTSAQLAAPTMRADLIQRGELEEQSRTFLRLLTEAVERAGIEDVTGAGWEAMREHLQSLSRARARQGFSPSATATFVFSLKEALFARLRREVGNDGGALADEI